jgi:hypothetical protein
MRGERGAVCLYGSIRAASTNPSHVAAAMSILLEAIRRDYPDAESVPRWNDRRGTPHLAARYLDRAAELANSRGL